jgi:hypothetical protein
MNHLKLLLPLALLVVGCSRVKTEQCAVCLKTDFLENVEMLPEITYTLGTYIDKKHNASVVSIPYASEEKVFQHWGCFREKLNRVGLDKCDCTNGYRERNEIKPFGPSTVGEMIKIGDKGKK